MADLDFTVGAQSDGSEAKFAAAVAAALEKAFSRVGSQLASEFSRQFRDALKGADPFKNMFADAQDQAKRIDQSFKNLENRINAVASSAEAARGSFGEAFDGRNLDGFESSLKNLISLSDELAAADMVDLPRLRQQVKAAEAEVRQQAMGMRQAELAQREAARDTSATYRAQLRARTMAGKAAAGVTVAATQAAGSKETALIRANAQQQVAITRSAAQRRAATFELIGRVVRSTERVIRSMFEGTARIATGAFGAIQRVASSAMSGVSSIFSRTGNRIRQTFTTTNNQINDSYNKTWKKNTSIVNNELGRQESGIKRFAAEATQSIGSIGVGTLGKFAVLGAAIGRALTGGFERAANIEDSERALTVMLGSAEAAQKLNDQVMDIVTGTPFKFDQFAQGATQMAAFSIEAEKIPRYLQAIGDAAAVRGGAAGQTIDTLITVFGQVSTAGRLMGQDLLQLTSAGVPALQILGNALGQTTEEMRETMADGAIDAERALEILTEGILNGSNGVNGMTAAMAGLGKELGGTLRGSMANFMTAIDRAGANIITTFKDLLTNVVQAATASVDAIGRITTAIGKAVKASPVVTLLSRAFDGLGDRITAFSKSAQPYVDSFARSLVAVGTGLAAIAALRRLPGTLGVIATTMYRMVTPARLVVAGMIAFKAIFDDMREDSPEFNEAIEKLGSTLSLIGRTILPPIVSVISAVAEGFANLLAPALERISDMIVAFLVPALERLNKFLETVALPALRRFSGYVRTTVAPAIADFLGTAAEKARELFGRLVDYIRDTVIPFVGPYLKSAVEIGQRAFESAYGFLSSKFVPFVRNNLIPVLSGLAGALGALALGGGFGAAGFLAVGGLAAAALTDDGVRSKILGYWDDIVANVRERLEGLFSDSNIQKVSLGAVRLAHKIGQVLGDAISDTRFVAAVAALGAAAVVLAGAFVTGLGRGIVENIPELVEMVRGAFMAVFDEVWKDKALFAGLLVALGGAALIANLVRSGRRAGRVFAQALGEGAVTVGGQGGGGSFFHGLFGGPSAIRSAAAQAGQQYGNTLQRSIRNQIRLIQNLGGNLPADPMGLQRGSGEPFADYNRRLSGTFRDLNTEVGRLEGVLGKAGVAGARFRDGLGQIASGRVREGIAQLGQAVRDAGKNMMAGAGEFAGGVFMASFVSSAIFDLKSSGADKLQAGVGLAMSGLMTASALGLSGGVGLAVGGAAAGLGALIGAFKASGEQAKEARARIQGYADAILEAKRAGEDTAPVIEDLFLNALGDQSEKAQRALADIGFNYKEFARSVQEGTVDQRFAGLTQNLNEFKSTVLIAKQDADAFGQSLMDAGLSGNEAYKVLQFLQGQMGIIGSSTSLADAASDLDAIANAGEVARQNFSSFGEAVGRGAAATATFRTRLAELNDERIDALRSQVDDAASALDRAGSAADAAKQKVIDFLTGNTEAMMPEQATNEAILNVARIAESVTGEMAAASANVAAGVEGASTVMAATYAEKIQGIKDEAKGILAAGEFGTVEDAKVGLQPLIDAAKESGEEAGAAAEQAISEILSNMETGQFKNLIFQEGEATAAMAAAQAELEAAGSALKLGMEIDPETIDELVEEATKAARKVDETFATTIEESSMVRTAATTMSKGAADGASMSSRSNWFGMGMNLMDGAAAGVGASAWRLAAAARAGAQRALDAVAGAWDTGSPSREAALLGGYFSEGLAEGIADAAPKALVAAVNVAERSLSKLSAFGREAAKAVGRGFAEGGPDFIKSIGSALDAAATTALSKADQFKAVGRELASSLFGSMGTSGLGVTGGGTARAELERQLLSITGVGGRFRDAVRQQEDKYGGFGLGLNMANLAGRANRDAFLQAGLDIRAYGQNLLDSGRSASSAVTEMQRWRDQIVGVARNVGGTTAEINDLLSMLGLTNSQLNQFTKDVKASEKAVRDATAAEQARIKAEAAAEAAKKRAEERAEADKKRAEEESRRAAEQARRGGVSSPIFRDLIVQPVGGDAEAIALATANKIASNIRR